MCDNSICFIRGDPLEKHYTFLDSHGYPLSRDIIKKVMFSADSLKHYQYLEYDEQWGEWKLFIPSRITKTFEPSVGHYNITLTLYDESNVTVIYNERIQVLRKKIVGE